MTEQEKQMWLDDLNMINKLNKEIIDIRKFYNNKINELYSKIDNQDGIIKDLQKQVQTKHDGFMASVDESCELAEENQKLKNDIKSLKSEIRVHSDKSNERYKAIKNQEKYISKLHLEKQKYFDMCIETEQKINKAIEYIENFLCTEEYIKVDGVAIADNYAEVLQILKGGNDE